MIGLRIAHYRIDAELGRGGMGIVYRATDTTLDRTVALKVLPPHALASEDDRARFYREARAAARLTHPHVATVYEIGEAAIIPEGEDPAVVASSTGADVRPFIAMEFVDGDSLADRIAAGPFRLDEAVRIATQVAKALGAAHEAGIVHRDVKSGNVMLTSKGEAKVLDFGLAKTASSTQLTRQGSTLGTVAYMSPEQARAEVVDARTDLWALGVVLYEMIAGRLPFQADYEQAALYGILNEDPEPLTALRTGVPMELEAIVSKLLRKDAKLRYQSAAGLVADLDAITLARTSSRSVPVMPAASGGERGTSGSRSHLYAAWAGVAGILVGTLATFALMRGDRGGGPGAMPADVVRSTIVLPADLPVDVTTGYTLGVEVDALDLSSDGTLLVYVAREGSRSVLVLMRMADGSSRVLDNTEGAFSPRFSPDGRWIAYIARDQLFRVPVDGGRPRYLADVSEPTGLTWHPDGFIYYADRQGASLFRVSPEGELAAWGPQDERCNCGLPGAGPADRGVVVSGRDQERTQWILPDGSSRDLDLRGNHLRFTAGGVALFTRTGSLHASRFDAESGSPVGEERIVLNDLRTGSILRSGHYALSDAGTLVYVAGEPSGLTQLVIRGPDGSEQPLDLPVGVYGPVVVSTDERRLLVRSYDRGGQTLEVDLQTGGERSVPATGEWANAIFHPGGAVTFVESDGDGSRVRSREPVGGRIETLFEADTLVYLSAWSPDGRYLAYRRQAIPAYDLMVRDMTDGSEVPLGDKSGDTYWGADFSPGSDLVAYTRVGEGGSQVFAEPFPPDGTTWLVSPDGGEEGEWLPDRDAIVYRLGRDWYIVDYSTEPEVSFSEPRLLFNGSYVNVAGMEYRMLTGERALLQRPVNTETTASRIEVITGFDRLLAEVLE